MSLTFDAVINPIILLLAIVAGVLVGLVLGRANLARSQSKLQKLEAELMNSHEETLESGFSKSKIYELVIPEENQIEYRSNYVKGIIRD